MLTKSTPPVASIASSSKRTGVPFPPKVTGSQGPYVPSHIAYWRVAVVFDNLFTLGRSRTGSGCIGFEVHVQGFLAVQDTQFKNPPRILKTTDSEVWTLMHQGPRSKWFCMP